MSLTKIIDRIIGQINVQRCKYLRKLPWIRRPMIDTNWRLYVDSKITKRDAANIREALERANMEGYKFGYDTAKREALSTHYSRVVQVDPQPNPVIEDLHIDLRNLHADTDSGYCSECGTNQPCETMILVKQLVEAFNE